MREDHRPIRQALRTLLAGGVMIAAAGLWAPPPAAAGEAPAAAPFEAPFEASDEGVDSGEAGEFTAQMARRHRRRQRRPVRMGSSIGNVLDFTLDGGFITCCSGTAGALLDKDGVLYILSNNHVTGRLNRARRGDPIGQPGLIDNRCEDEPDDYVAFHTGQKRIRFRRNNRVDAAISEVIEGAVDPTGRILGLGIPGSTPIEPAIGMKVRKSGRTSGVRTGTIEAVNVTLSVGYEVGCGTGDERSARFVGQAIIAPGARPFVLGGDSGALVVEKSNRCPNPVGLLYAGGSDGSGAISPIEDVLRFMSRIRPRGEATIVGCEPEPQALAASAALARGGVALWDEADLERGRSLQRRIEPQLFERPEVHGVGLGVAIDDPSEMVLKVYVDDEAGREGLPAAIDGLRTEVVVSGRFEALGNCSRRPR